MSGPVVDAKFIGRPKKVKPLNILKKLGLKRSASGYQLYVKASRAVVLADFPLSKNRDIIQEVARRWRECTEEERRPFVDEGNRNKIAYFENKRKREEELGITTGGRKKAPPSASESSSSSSSSSAAALAHPMYPHPNPPPSVVSQQQHRSVPPPPPLFAGGAAAAAAAAAATASKRPPPPRREDTTTGNNNDRDRMAANARGAEVAL